ncbi:MAG: HDOD domain-containing protein [Pseudomonadota bacterium]
MSPPSDNARIQAILASGIKIPPLPEVLLKVQALAQDPDAGIGDIADLIRKDGAMSGAVLRVVGSPVFGLRTRVETPERAVTLLGVPPTLAILRGIALRNALHDPVSQAALEVLWQRSGHIAQRAMALARHLRGQGISPDQAYTLGMFHDCGLALAIKRFPAYGKALAGPDWPDIPALDQAHDTDHALLGGMVARNWQLPEGIALAIHHHHQPGADLPPDIARLTAVLNLACQLQALASGTRDPGWEAGWKTVAMEHLGLNEDAIADLARENEAALETD